MIKMNNDCDYGGTTDGYPEERYGNGIMESENHTFPDTVHNKEDVENMEKFASLHNPEYTDSLTSNGSDVPLLDQDRNQIWEKTDETEKTESSPFLEYIENLACDYKLTQTASEDKTNDIQTQLLTLLDESHGKKEFEITVVEIVPKTPEMREEEPVWESTAYIDEFTCPSPGTRRLERVCKMAMMNLSQDLSCKGSMKGSTLLPVLINQAPEQPVFEEESLFEGNEIKNLLVMSVSVAFMNAAYSSLRNLQSSMNHEGGVGVYSLTGSCAAFTLLSIFTPSIIQQFRPKRCFILALLTHLIYVAANVAPHMYVLIPASILQGAGAALLWNAVSTYITFLARSNALRNDKRTVHVASKYFGIFFCFYQLSIVLGNLISSIVLFNGQNSSEELISVNNNTVLQYESETDHLNHSLRNLSRYTSLKQNFCGANYCNSFKIDHETVKVAPEARYNLLGIYGVATVLSLILPLLLMDQLKNYRTAAMSLAYISHQGKSVMKCMVQPRFLTCFIIFIYSNMELGFVTAEVTKAFITCPLGIHMVGYTMICFGLCGSLSSFVGGKLEKHVGNVSLIATATIIHLVLLALMLTWEPDPNKLYLFFLLLGSWGVADGIWMSQVNCVVGTLFPDTLEDAFASLRVLNGLGMTIGFAYSNSLCMAVKIYILLMICLSGTVIYAISEIVRKHRKPKVLDEEEIKT